MASQSVGWVIGVFHKLTGSTQYPVPQVRHQQTGIYIQHLVKSTRYVKPQGKTIIDLIRGHFLRPQPATVRAGKLHLIAIAEYLFRRDDRMDRNMF